MGNGPPTSCSSSFSTDSASNCIAAILRFFPFCCVKEKNSAFQLLSPFSFFLPSRKVSPSEK
jgi:hypothetical protein